MEQRGEVKIRWSREEIVLLAQKELELETQNVFFMNAALVTVSIEDLGSYKGKKKVGGI